MNAKERLVELIKTIKNLTGETQEQISVSAGYKPKSLTQLLSNKEGHEVVVKKLEIAYKSVLKNYTKPIDMNVSRNNEGLNPLEERLKDKDKLIAALERENELLRKQNETSLIDILGAVQVNQEILGELYENLVEDSKKDKTLSGVSRRGKNQGI